MRIISYLDRRLRPIIEDPRVQKAKGIEPARVKRIGAMIEFILGMTNPLQLKTREGWRAHNYPNDRVKWSLDISGNWRLVFRVDTERQEVSDLDIDDPH